MMTRWPGCWRNSDILRKKVRISHQNIKSFTRFFSKNRRGPGGSAPGRPPQRAKLPPAAAGETPARRNGRNSRAAHGAKPPIVPKRHPQMAQLPAKPKAAVPTPSAGGGRRPYVVAGNDGASRPHKPRGTVRRIRRAAPVCAAVSYRATLTVARGRMRNRFVGRGILDASVAHSIRGRQGCWPLRPAEKMAPTVHPHRGRRRGPWPLAGGCARCDGRLGRQGVSPRARGGYFARCGGRPEALPLDSAIF